ncbi:MAG: Na/Pi cotransporter family protein [Chitinophagales bacterium]|nr:Na/Pi cotransporter family protein [Chitinophagales bacterium]
MNYTFLDLLHLVGSLGIFIYGMKLMSEALQKVAGNSLRNILRGMTSTRLSGVITGIITTALIQSSSATTVMVVSFVNAGLLTLVESMGVIMGANIGTTVTAWLITVLGFSKFKIAYWVVIMVGISFPMLFSKANKFRFTAEFILGFGILFIGLDLLKGSVPDLASNREMLKFVTQITDMGYASYLLFILIGTILTIVIQSSSATMAITLTMLADGWISFPIAAAMVLGENIGTTITANIAAVVGNINAKRAARFHLLFNVFGVLCVLLIFEPYTRFIYGSIDSFMNFLGASVGTETIFNKRGLISLSLFHTIFNIANVALLFGFVPLMQKLVIKMVPTRTDEDEESRLMYISTGLLATPELSLANANKEIAHFAKIVDKMGHNVAALLFESKKNHKKIINKIARREEITDTLEIELSKYLARVSESDLSRDASEKIRSMLAIGNDLERIADIYFEISRNFSRMDENKLKFPEDAKKELKKIIEKILGASKIMYNNVLNEDIVNMSKVYEKEYEINILHDNIVKSHLNRLEKRIYSSDSGVIFLDFVNGLERVADHFVNVNEEVAGLK